MSEGCCCFSPSAEWPGRTIGLTSEILDNPVTGCTPRFQVFFMEGAPLGKNGFLLWTKLAVEIAFDVSARCLRRCSNCFPNSPLPLVSHDSFEREAYFGPILLRT